MEYKKILVLSASAGAGHVRAADALVRAFQASGRAKEIVHLDTLEYTSKAVRTLYAKAYFEMARTAPDVLGWVYDLLDKPARNEKKMRALERINVALFMRLLRRIQPDLVVNTHFLPADIIGYLRRKERLSCRSAVVITDYDAHAMWINRDVDFYCTACEEETMYLRALGIPAEHIATTGIPIDPVFGEHKDKFAMREKHGLHRDRPTILISTGGFGVGNSVSILEALRAMHQPAQVVVICGKNAELFDNVKNFVDEHNATSAAVRIHPVGFTTEMDEYMSAADLIIGKPGGLTSSEAMAKGLAFVILNPIPGQEERNSDYLLEHGAAVKCNNILTLAYKVDQLLAHPHKLETMRANALAVARPHAATSVVNALCG